MKGLKSFLLLFLSVLLVFSFSCKKEGKMVTVGAKNFTEQYVVGNLMSELLKDNGFTVKEQFGTGSKVAREGLTTGQTDMYAEYTGTAWLVYLGHTEKIADPFELFQKVKQEDLERNNIAWLDRWSLNNTYALAIKQDMTERYGSTISELGEYINSHPGELSVAIDQEFYERPDGFPAMVKKYGINIEEAQMRMMDIGLSYEALVRGQVDVAMVFATDGLLKKYNFKVLKDDRQFFPIYNIAPTIRKETLDKYPEIEEIMRPLTELIDDKAMQELNYKVDAEGLPAQKVAEDFLNEHGLLKK